MIKLLKFIGIVALLFTMIGKSYAIDAPTNLKVDSSTDTSVNLSWSAVDGALMYYLYYGNKSGIDNDYELQSDFVETNSIEVTGLDTGSTYYFSVIALDNNAEESIYSDELMIDVGNPVVTGGVASNFVLENAELLDYNKLELSFSLPLDNSKDPIREFKITNKSDILETVEVVSTELNKNDDSKIILTLENNLTVGTEFEVVIVAITSSNGSNIESGIDNIETFTVSEISEPYVEPVIEEVIEEPSVDLNAAEEKTTGPSGEVVASENIENTTIALASNNDKLPQTGPEHILMFILSIILGTLIFIFKYKKA